MLLRRAWWTQNIYKIISHSTYPDSEVAVHEYVGTFRKSVSPGKTDELATVFLIVHVYIRLQSMHFSAAHMMLLCEFKITGEHTPNATPSCLVVAEAFHLCSCVELTLRVIVFHYES